MKVNLISFCVFHIIDSYIDVIHPAHGCFLQQDKVANITN
jgi:hypothetical protein